MGDRWKLQLGDDILLGGGKNRLPTQLLTVFGPDDRFLSVTDDAADELEEADEDENYDDDGDGFEHEPRVQFGYRARVKTVRARLSLMGFDPEQYRHQLAEDLAEQAADNGEDGLYCYPSGRRYGRGPGDGPEPVRFDVSWVEAVDIGLAAYAKKYRVEGSTADLTGLEACCVDRVESQLEFEDDFRRPLAALLQGQDPELVLRLDLTDLFEAGFYFDETDDLTAQAREELREANWSTGPIIVVTEGTFDAQVLDQALRIVRPDIAGYFRFLDFTRTKAGGGVDQVVANLRSFAAAGISNRVIGLLDNDTAGRIARATLNKAPLPRGYSVCCLPDLDYARAWPTLGPTGTPTSDVNGRGCSVEFYFGLDCLRTETGDPVPVRWTAYRKEIDDYQAELTDKAGIQQRILNMLATADTNTAADDSQWEPMRQIARTLIEAALS